MMVRLNKAAADFGVNFAPFKNQQDLLAKIPEVLIVATGADHAIITREEIENSHVKVVFDLAVPSNVSPAVREIPGVQLYNK